MVAGAAAATGWANTRSITIDGRPDGPGLNIGFNGTELLCLAVGACYTNELFCEAERRGIRIRSVHVDVTAEAGGCEARDLTVSMRVEADAREASVADLIEHTDKVASIPNLLRLGTSVRLTDAHVVVRSERG
jgi:uncharacterized OsmC-like protein